MSRVLNPIVSESYMKDYIESEGFIKPSGKITITENGTDIDVRQYRTADVDVTGGGGDSIPIRYIKCNIINNTTYDLYAGYTGTSPDFCNYAVDGDSQPYLFTMEGVNALVNSDIDTPVKIANANGGTGVIYYIPQYFWKDNQPSYISFQTDGASTNFTDKTNVTWYEDSLKQCIKLTDDTQNGEFTWTITTAYFPD